MARAIVVASLLAVLVEICIAGEESSCMVRTAPQRLGQPTGVFAVDLRQSVEELSLSTAQDAVAEDTPSRKSPLLAAGMSAVLPGAGEFYAGSYVKSAAFLAVEVGLWIAAYSYDKKGDRQTDFFQGFADTHWSVVRYGSYAVASGLAPTDGNYQWLIPGTEGLQPWQRVNWNELNRMERDIAATDAGRYYSHVLPRYGEQQYYELIGKYPQFNQGWDDSPSSFAYGDALTARFVYYAAERGKANDYYNTASTMTAIVIVNHIVSMIDAAFTAAAYNRGLHAEGSSMTLPVPGGVQTIPAMTMRYRW
jgi:hypothetical protein